MLDFLNLVLGRDQWHSQDFTLTWTLAPFSDHGGLPPVASFRWGDDTVYFAETTSYQLQPNGTGFGTFETDSNTTASRAELGGSQPNSALDARDVTETVDTGALLRCVRFFLVVTR